MKQLLLLLICLALILSSIGSAAALIPPNPEYNRYLVGFHDTVDHALIKEYEGIIKRKFHYMPVVAVKLDPNNAEALSKHPKVKYVEEDGEMYAIEQKTPWGISKIKAIQAQNESGFTGKGVKIGIVDTGIDYNHEDLKVAGGATFVNGTSDYMDDNGHGTHIAGTISALDNSIGVIGVAPNSEIYAIKALDRNGTGRLSDYCAGIEWTMMNEIDIINISSGARKESETLKQVLKLANNQGVFTVGAAGNKGFNENGSIVYPAKYPEVFSVGAVDKDNKHASFSSVGKELDIVAPGVDILSTTLNGYGTKDGTSMAAPHVTGAAALLLEKNPQFTPAQLRNMLLQSAHPLNDSFSSGKGLIDISKALKAG
jgi:subtilisin